jgi:hypothetical protein
MDRLAIAFGDARARPPPRPPSAQRLFATPRAGLCLPRVFGSLRLTQQVSTASPTGPAFVHVLRATLWTPLQMSHPNAAPSVRSTRFHASFTVRRAVK